MPQIQKKHPFSKVCPISKNKAINSHIIPKALAKTIRSISNGSKDYGFLDNNQKEDSDIFLNNSPSLFSREVDGSLSAYESQFIKRYNDGDFLSNTPEEELFDVGSFYEVMLFKCLFLKGDEGIDFINGHNLPLSKKARNDLGLNVYNNLNKIRAVDDKLDQLLFYPIYYFKNQAFLENEFDNKRMDKVTYLFWLFYTFLSFNKISIVENGTTIVIDIFIIKIPFLIIVGPINKHGKKVFKDQIEGIREVVCEEYIRYYSGKKFSRHPLVVSTNSDHITKLNNLVDSGKLRVKNI
jgi:hypothetical protein